MTTLSLLCLVLATASPTSQPEIILEPGPAGQVVLARVDLTAAAQWCKKVPLPARELQFVDATGKPLAAQFVPSADFDAGCKLSGVLLLKRPAAGPLVVRLAPSSGVAARAKEPAWDGTVATPVYRVHHDAARQGGLPWKIEFLDHNGRATKSFDSIRWRDRLYDKPRGSFELAQDKSAEVKRLAAGPLATVVRVAARYLAGGGKTPPGAACAVYDWYYFAEEPLVYVEAHLQQQPAEAWREAHFLELNFPDKAFSSYVGDGPATQAAFADNLQSHRFGGWAALLEGSHSLAMLAAAPVVVYDGHRNYGRYLHACTDRAWGGWDGTDHQFSAWLRIGDDREPAAAIRTAAERLPPVAEPLVTVAALRQKIAAALGTSAGRAPLEAAIAAQLESQGRLREAEAAIAGQLPAGLATLTAGSLGLAVRGDAGGVHLATLYDLDRRQSLLAREPMALWEIVVRDSQTKEEVRLAANSGWSQATTRPATGGGLELAWSRPQDKRFGELQVLARATPVAASSALSWDLEVGKVAAPWSIWRVVFPRLALRDLGPECRLLVPQAAGVVKRLAETKSFRFTGTYPSGWCTMQFMGLYEPALGTGLYVGLHDPWGGTKDLLAELPSQGHVARLSYDHAAVDMGKPGNEFHLPGPAVWQLVRGDWFDASVIYRDWVRREARWYPKLGPDGREDTPRWMRELCAWSQRGGRPSQVVEPNVEFAKALGQTIGFHWYSWHQIPFDNDYPHYFPAHEGFANAVAALQSGGVQVMPYINGRLWDTRDRGQEDFQFTSVARPAATKDPDGKPYLETYGSKEKDGSKVALAAMCPATALWQAKQREIVLRLMNECGVRGVYMDQIAAAKANLCFDATHGHPLGGGHWWTEHGYWPLLEAIRKAMPRDRMLTTECNAEPYIRWFDGYLTWHWQYDGQVPAFPAVYGGAIQMFGRAYRGGPTKDLALRMKAAEQLVFGEQLGWLDPGVVREKENFAFFRQAAQLRWQLCRYFYAGEMARPPHLGGAIPTVEADWQWHGVWPVKAPAVRSGAWFLPREKRLVLIFANTDDRPHEFTFDYDLRPYGLEKATWSAVSAESVGGTAPSPRAGPGRLSIPARAMLALEVRAE